MIISIKKKKIKVDFMKKIFIIYNIWEYIERYS